ncbi:MAG: T9SS type A sorting domain-containing protein, partial [Candidatus Heimdallarchaeota archaeon]|nr:T9SS type A sorting domain-containing protein [Candidatus Heimdallarchaeota archaeon]
IVSTDVTSIQDEEIPGTFELGQDYPNPFNPSTVISFSIPETDMVTLKVYDIIGNEIAVLINSTMNAGNFKYNFSAANLPSGIYFYELLTSKFRSVKKMILEK